MLNFTSNFFDNSPNNLEEFKKYGNYQVDNLPREYVEKKLKEKDKKQFVVMLNEQSEPVLLFLDKENKLQSVKIERYKIQSSSNEFKIEDVLKYYQLKKPLNIKQEFILDQIKKDPLNASENIKEILKENNIDLLTEEGQKILVKIAKIVAQTYGSKVSEYIQNYTIFDEKARVEIAELAIRNDVKSLKFIDRYAIYDSQALNMLLVQIFYSLKNQFLNLETILSQEELQRLTPELQLFYLPKLFELGKGENKEIEIQEALNEIKEFCASHAHLKPFYEFTLTYFSQLKDKQDIQAIKQRLLVFVGLTLIRLSDLSPENHKVAYSIFQQILVLQDSSLRYEIFDDLFIPLFNSASLDLYQNLREEMKGNYAILPLAFLAAFFEEKQAYLILSHLKQLKEKRTPIIKEKHFRKCLLQVLHLFSQDKSLSVEQKKSILQILLDPKKDKLQIREALQTVRGLFSMEKHERLKDLVENKYSDSYVVLNRFYQQEVVAIIPLKEKFTAEKIISFFEQFRKPNVILSYATSLKGGISNEYTKENSQLMLDSLANFIDLVLTEQFSNWRYNNSTHLQKVFYNNQELQELWKKNDKISLEDLLPDLSLNKKTVEKSLISPEEFTVVETDDLNDLFLHADEVPNCISPYADSSTNKCLLACVIDGKNKLIAIKDKNGKIKSHAILRILLDKKTEKPVLALEGIFQDISIPREWKSAIIAMAKHKANILQLPLVSGEIIGSDRYPNSIVSLGSAAPYEYKDSDALGAHKNGVFEISYSFVL